MTKFEHADILDLLGGDIDDNAVMRLVFECLISGIDDDRVVSLMNLIGWRGSFSCFALGERRRIPWAPHSRRSARRCAISAARMRSLVCTGGS